MSETIFSSYWSDWTESIEEFYKSCHHYISKFTIEEMNDLLYEETIEFEKELIKQMNEF